MRFGWAYSIPMAGSRQPGAVSKTAAPAVLSERLAAAGVLAFVCAVFATAALAANGAVNLSRLLGPCGFEQRYGMPCPTCGMVRSAMLFTQGRFMDSFYMQPAGAVFCFGLAAVAFFAFVTAVFGVRFPFLKFVKEIGIGYLILIVLAIIAGGWAVTLSRAMDGRW